MRLIIYLAFLLSLSPISAKTILADLALYSGDWALVGVPLHNYQLIPIQQELGTFITTNKSLLTKLQSNWDFEPTLEDDCDYHYSLKFYQDKQLVKTVLLNLHCGYVTVEGRSYRFFPEDFEELKNKANAISWSRISFGDLDVLKKAINTLNNSPEVYWYEDVKQYEYDGFFMLNLNNLPWNTDLDSLQERLQYAIERKTGSTDFYLQEYFHIVQGEKMSARYLVNCDEDTGDRLAAYAMVPWRSHLHNRDSVRILAIGLDRRKYKKLMRE
ncbi:MAG: hypothetical protein AAF927_17740 [Bacteroidota bacterium]